MSHDIIADALNNLMNAKRAKKKNLVVKRYSKVLLNVLKIAKDFGYIDNYKIDGTNLEIVIGEVNQCNAIKPRHSFSVDEIPKFMKRYLPARDLGVLIVSTNKGMMTHNEAAEKNIGGCLIAYFY